MTDREAETLLPPPPDSFVEPASACRTEPPLSPAMVDAIKAAVTEAIAPLAAHWGNLYVAQQSHLERVEEIAKNAIALGAERERTSTTTLLAFHALLRQVAHHVGLPEELPIAELAARSGE